MAELAQGAGRQGASPTAPPAPAMTRCASTWPSAPWRRSWSCSPPSATWASPAPRRWPSCAERGVALPREDEATTPSTRACGAPPWAAGRRRTPGATLPEAAFPGGVIALGPQARTLVIGFEQGVPVALDGNAMDPVALIAQLNALGQPYGLGRGVHLGDTILGIKGRVGFEAPAAHLLIGAHRELEKLVLSRQAALLEGERSATSTAALLHEGHFFDPLARDLEAFLQSSQDRVSGRGAPHPASPRLRGGGRASPYSLMDPRSRQLRRGQPGSGPAPRPPASPRSTASQQTLTLEALRVPMKDPRRQARLGHPEPPAGPHAARSPRRSSLEEGAVIACRIRGEKTVYNQLEDVHGRHEHAARRGHRRGRPGPPQRAARATRASCPRAVKPGRHAEPAEHGRRASATASPTTRTWASPSRLEVLGQVLVFPEFQSRAGQPAHIRTGALKGTGPQPSGARWCTWRAPA